MLFRSTLAWLGNPSAVVLDGVGNLYFSDYSKRVVRKISPLGIITTVAGNAAATSLGDGGPATAALLGGPSDIAMDSSGNLYITEYDTHGVRKFTPGGIITTVAGNHISGSGGDGGAAISASLANPEGVAVDNQGNLFIADRSNGRIRKVTPGGIITTVAGGGGAFGDGGLATNAQLDRPMDVAVDAAGNLFIPDLGFRRLRKVSAGGTITTVAGSGQPRYSGDRGPATRAELDEPRHTALDAAGNLFIADVENNVIRKISTDGTITTVAGTGQRGLAGDGGAATSALLKRPHGVAVGPDGSIYIADFDNARVRKVSPLGIISTFAGGGAALGDNGPATSAQLSAPSGVALDAAGNVFISECGGNRVRKVTPTGTITTVAGTGQSGSFGDGGPATAATLNCVSAVAVDASGNLYLSDIGNNRVRKVSQGTITAFAGTGQSGFSGDGGPATSAAVSGPEGLARSEERRVGKECRL